MKQSLVVCVSHKEPFERSNFVASISKVDLTSSKQ